jgi:hypothetical protein
MVLQNQATLVQPLIRLPNIRLLSLLLPHICIFVIFTGAIGGDTWNDQMVPFLKFLTDIPTSTITPKSSWPNEVPGFTVGVLPFKMP